MRPGERPSMVVTALPFTPETGIRQENMRSPSMCTMHAPHWPAPHPNLVPVSLSSSRSTHRRRVLSGALTLTGLPLTLKLIAISTPMCLGRAGFVRGWLSTMLLPAQNRGQCCAATNRVSVAPVPRLWRRSVWVSVSLAPRRRSSLAANHLQLVPGRTMNLTIRKALLAAAVALPLAASAAEYMEKTPFQLSRAFSPGVVTDGGKIVWVAGQTASRDNEGQDIANNFEAQAKQGFSQIDQVMKPAGGSLANNVP